MSAAEPRTRLVALDALRGVAAVVVLVHHVSMTAPSISAAYSSSANVAIFSTGWWATLSPLKIFFAGPEFVLVFFVLSGFVLVLAPLRRWPWMQPDAHPAAGTQIPVAPPAHSAGYDWLAYYPRRVIRLAIPVLVSVGLAAVWIALVPRSVDANAGAWMAKQGDAGLGIGNLLREASIVGYTGRPDVNPPLWSLAWEMWFSLLLPIGVILAVATRRWTLAWVAVLLATSTIGYVLGIEPLMYLPAFGLGALLAANHGSLLARSTRLARRRGGTLAWAAIAILGPALLIGYWLARPLLSEPWNSLALALRVPGAVLIVATVALWSPVQRLLSGRLLGWLGAISFSLYLVHFPVVVTFAQLFGPEHWWWGALISVPLSLVLAQLMYRWVELPAQALATRAGAAFSASHPRPEAATAS
ncbi:acyltransferase [Cryobacterium sp. PAMC25264]|uniref:acyltransferase family protein n=1 Tax=Cryobacterium sp. PAMC25264 TaxID=2861288 RepID=UPI001C63885E|nr:acyltransferase [Cryobacterium sp. PAMC25264]QYF73755.1 acyltransferase [Cryobacterium sp. PAMC25264]